MNFKNRGTEDVFHGEDSRAARMILPVVLRKMARRKLTLLNAITRVDELRMPLGNRLESLTGDREGLYSIRINARYRICFAWVDGVASDVEIVDYH